MTEREIYESYRAPEPSPDLVQRIAAAVEAERARRRRRRLFAIAAALALVLGGAALLVLWPSPPRQGQVQISGAPRSLELGRDIVATAQPGARLSWSEAGAGVVASQASGVVRYRVPRGIPLEVEVPGGFVRVLGTVFDVEVSPMRRSLRKGAVGAAVLAVVAVTVYQGRVLLGNEERTVEVGRNERGELKPGEGPRLSRRALSSAPASRPAPTKRAWARRLASREARRELLRLVHRAREQREQGAAPMAASGAGGRGAELAPATGSLDKEYIRSTINEAIPLVKECYELALRERPGLGGTLKVRFTIGAEPEVGGLVEQVEIDGQDPAALDPGLRECMEQTIYSLEFPPPEGGGRVNVTYPFRFAVDKSKAQPPR